MPGGVGSVGFYVMMPAQVALATLACTIGSLTILDINVFAYNEKLERQYLEEEELVKRMAID